MRRATRFSLLLALTIALGATHARAADRAAILSGAVHSRDEGPMEGVLVTARKRGSPIAVTVVSDVSGAFSFPSDLLSAGEYTIAVRAAGYEFADKPPTVQLTAEGGGVDIELRPTNDIAPQLTNADWFDSIPGAERDKRPLMACMSCHSLERIVRSTHDANGFTPVLRRMVNYVAESGRDDIPQRASPRDIPENKLKSFATYLASINRSRGEWSWRPRMAKRPKGRATKVIVTEYDLPRATIAPHDVWRDDDGIVWYSNSAEQFLGRLDPRDGAHREFPLPVSRPDSPHGALDLEADANGDLWLALMYQGGLAKFERRTETFSLFSVSPGLASAATQQAMVAPSASHVDGKVWTNEVGKQAIMRVDIATGRYEMVEPFANSPPGAIHTPYGMVADAANNLWFLDFGGQTLGKIDAGDLAVTHYATPTPASRPRRGRLNGNTIWFAEFGADQLAAFDISRETFREWPTPSAHSFPYDAFMDRAGDLWSGNMANDRVLRMRPENGSAVEYLLPLHANIRRVFVDDATPRRSLWAGDNHGARIFRVEPLD
jgi:streptogramin lyase